MFYFDELMQYVVFFHEFPCYVYSIISTLIPPLQPPSWLTFLLDYTTCTKVVYIGGLQNLRNVHQKKAHCQCCNLDPVHRHMQAGFAPYMFHEIKK